MDEIDQAVFTERARIIAYLIALADRAEREAAVAATGLIISIVVRDVAAKLITYADRRETHA